MVHIGVLIGLREGLCNQVNDADIGSGNMGSDTAQLAPQLGQHDSEGFGDPNEVGYDVHSSNMVSE